MATPPKLEDAERAARRRCASLSAEAVSAAARSASAAARAAGALCQSAALLAAANVAAAAAESLAAGCELDVLREVKLREATIRPVLVERVAAGKAGRDPVLSGGMRAGRNIAEHSLLGRGSSTVAEALRAPQRAQRRGRGRHRGRRGGTSTGSGYEAEPTGARSSPTEGTLFDLSDEQRDKGLLASKELLDQCGSEHGYASALAGSACATVPQLPASWCDVKVDAEITCATAALGTCVETDLLGAVGRHGQRDVAHTRVAAADLAAGGDMAEDFSDTLETIADTGSVAERDAGFGVTRSHEAFDIYEPGIDVMVQTDPPGLCNTGVGTPRCGTSDFSGQADRPQAADDDLGRCKGAEHRGREREEVPEGGRGLVACAARTDDVSASVPVTSVRLPHECAVDEDANTMAAVALRKKKGEEKEERPVDAIRGCW